MLVRAGRAYCFINLQCKRPFFKNELTLKISILTETKFDLNKFSTPDCPCQCTYYIHVCVFNLRYIGMHSTQVYKASVCRPVIDVGDLLSLFLYLHFYNRFVIDS